MDLKTQLDNWSAQLNAGLAERNVETCMEAIKQLKALGANVTFSLAPEEPAQQPADPQPDQGHYYQPQA